VRADVRQSFVRQGLRVCRDANGMGEICNELRGGELDLLITVPEFGGNDVGVVIQQMRHQRMGENPFVVVMTLVDQPNPAVIRRVVDAGVDDVLVMPMSPAQMVSRLNNFVLGRKPFIVTHDYIGPERRTNERDGTNIAASMTVPNPIRWQVVANAGASSLRAQIQEAGQRINVHKMKSYCGHISQLAGRIVTAYHANERDEMIEDVLSLGSVADDLMLRMDGTSFATRCELVQSLQALSGRLARLDRTPRVDEVEILPTLSRAIQRVFEEDGTAVAWTQLASVL
jgi:DNA-binding response OmpR family regulator